MNDHAACQPERIQEALEEILASETFARAEQLRSFLRYVCERTLAGRGNEINEFSVGIEALGKAGDFSPAEDSSVRTRAYELRQRLQKYYEFERPDASIRIELPKGAYTPQFIEHHPPSVEPVVPMPDVAPREKRRAVPILTAALSISLLCLVAVSIIAFSRTSLTVLKEAWGPLARPGADVLMIIATELRMDVHPGNTAVVAGTPVYPAYPELYRIFRQHRPLEPGAPLFMRSEDNAVHLGHAQSLAILAVTLRQLGVAWQSLPERNITVPALRDRNVVLIGNPQYSEAVALTLEEAPLTVEFDPALKGVVVRDRRDAGKRWEGKPDQDHHLSEVFGLLTVLPAEGETHGPHRMVVISGTTSAAALGAAEYFTSEESLRLLRQKLGGSFPSAYQVVVRCRASDTMLLSTEYAAHRVVAW